MADQPEKPHTVKAGIMDAMLGLKGPNGELMFQGKPALVVDLPDDEDDDDG
ncbi:hypothetical protein [uncultured Phenylobacterium sp.]|uniref:hypothetical protein n=1 Tax=uncultured Phenylobacterium sp. TaxID=349273 RepID=UPI0025E295FB|nr:hypothetical protein [uncultured Phenylobacterium sp.]